MNDLNVGGDMTMFADIVSRAQKSFPALTIKYKDQSWLMKLLSKILFFSPNFMDFTTTIGSTIYLPSEAKVKISPVSSTVVFLHELSHIFDNSKEGPIFSFLYLFPQILALLAIPAFIFFGFKLALFFLLFLLPIPAYFRMKEERQAYVISLYVMNKLNTLYAYNIDLDQHKDVFISEFSNSNYYYMWPFASIKASFDADLEKLRSGENPDYDPDLYKMIDSVLTP